MRIAWPLPLLCLFLIAPFSGGMTCVHAAAERKMTLARPVDQDRVQAVIRATPGAEHVTVRSAGTGRLFFLIPVKRDVYHRFLLRNELEGRVRHQEGGKVLHLKAGVFHRRPDEGTRRRARDLLDRLERDLLDAHPTEPSSH